MTAPKINVDSFWLPRASSTTAASTDMAWASVMLVCIAFFVLLMGLMGYFVWKYRRRRPGEVTSAIDHSTRLEVFWTAIPLVIVIALFFIGLAGWVHASVPPADAFEIQVTAKKWAWTFTYPNGTISQGKLVVPLGKPVRLVMSSQDVLHSFYVPEFRIKQDVVPGSYTSIWFEATNPGDMTILCTEYCGTGHSDMLGTVSVLQDAEFKDWLENGGRDKSVPPAEQGKRLYASAGCNACHSTDGSRGQGPSFKGLFGRTEELVSGGTVQVDENYLRESILIPTAKVVKGYQPIMPSFKGQLQDWQVDALIAYLKEQK